MNYTYYPPDFFTDEAIEDVYLTAERTGEPVNERHLASIHKSRALRQMEMEKGLAEDLDAATRIAA